jgi:hypothetical protein
MFDQTIVGRHRWQALINGFVVGMGFATIGAGNFLGGVFIAIGLGMEYWHRKRMKPE